MWEDEQTRTEESDVVFSARYMVIKVWFSVLVAFTFPMWAFFRGAYLALLQGEYLDSFICSILPLPLLLITLDSILFKELIFYQDRVVKTWYPIGRTTIYYSQAKVTGPPVGYKLFSSGYAIRETNNGKNFFRHIPIGYIAFFFPSDAAKTIGKILDYLTEDTERNPRLFRKARLPWEVVRPSEE